MPLLPPTGYATEMLSQPPLPHDPRTHALNNNVRSPRAQAQLINFHPTTVNGKGTGSSRKCVMIGVRIYIGVANWTFF